MLTADPAQRAGARLRLERVSKSFTREGQSAFAAVRDVSLTVEPGELVTLLGPSGCGKTTTLRVVAGFEQPDEGRVYVGEQDVTDLIVYRRSIGFVFQSYALFPHLTIFDNVAYGLRVRRLPAATIRARVGQVLELVGLPGYERRFPNQLSGGEQQRVAVARAVVVEPQLLLFDEPLSNLDAKLRVQMRAELSRLQRQLAITTVYVTHDQEEALAISDRHAARRRGEVVAPGVVRSRTFLGEKVEYTVEVAGTLLEAVTYDPTRRGVFDVGARVGVSCEATSVRPLASEPGT